MYPDGICRVTDAYYTKTVQFQDINYQLSQNEDKTAIFDGWCDFLNYFDSSIHFQLSFFNLAAGSGGYAEIITIQPRADSFNSVREEYSAMLQSQLAKGNNGLTKTKCKVCGRRIAKSAKRCPSCGAKQGGIGKKIGIAVLVLLVIGMVAPKKDKGGASPVQQLSQSIVSAPGASAAGGDGSPGSDAAVPGGNPVAGDAGSGSSSVTVSGGSAAGADSGRGGSFTDLGLGDAAEKDGVYVGLQYVKSMTYLPTVLGGEEISSDNEVLLAFFEFCNGTDSTKSARSDKITCYVDGEQAGDVETYIKIVVDGVRQHHMVDLDAGCQLLTVADFEVRKGWSEVKFFYGSDCVWTITPADVSAHDYNRVPDASGKGGMPSCTA